MSIYTYHHFTLVLFLLIHTTASKHIPLPPSDLPPPIMPAFGPTKECGPTGSRQYKSGAYCYPYYKFTISSILNSPGFKGCCRPCPEQFGLELGLLDISPTQKQHVMHKFKEWSKTRSPAHKLQHVSQQRFLESENTLKQKKGGKAFEHTRYFKIFQKFSYSI
jgi:hypothetical protein